MIYLDNTPFKVVVDVFAGVVVVDVFTVVVVARLGSSAVVAVVIFGRSTFEGCFVVVVGATGRTFFVVKLGV